MRRLLAMMLAVALAIGECYAATSTEPAAITVQAFNPDGKPAAGAIVVQSLSGRQEGIIDTGDHADLSHWNPMVFTAGADGRFSIGPQTVSYEVAIYSSAGYAVWSSSHPPGSGSVKLSPWAKLRGQALVDRKPAAHREVQVDIMVPDNPWPSTEASVHWYVGMETDNDGKFLVPRLPTGTARVALLFPHQNPTPADPFWAGPDSTFVDVASGQTADVTVGLPGRSVQFEIKIPAALAATRKDWGFGFAHLMTRFVFPPALDFPWPADVARGSREQRAQWIGTFDATPEGKVLEVEQNRWLHKQRLWRTNALPQDDGTFFVPDVPPGNYLVEISTLSIADLSAPDGARPGFRPLAWARGTFTVPPIREGVKEEPLKVPLELVPVVSAAGTMPSERKR